MKSWKIEGPRRFKGELAPPGDKSITHRALMIGALARGETIVNRPLQGLDCKATAAAVEAMGAKIKRAPKVWRVVGRGPQPLAEPGEVLDCGNSGTSIRLLAGLVAGHAITATLTGDESIRRRPMARVLEPLAAMGATVLGREANSRAPFTIRGGKLVAKSHTLAVASAQAKSAILLAALKADGITTVNEPGQSRDHTERMLLHFGAALTSRPGSVSLKGGETLDAQELFVPGDLSSAAFFLVGASCAPGSSLRLTEVGVNPTRTGVLVALARMGAKITRDGERDTSGEPMAELVAHDAALSATEIAATEIPSLIDEVPILAVAAARAQGTTRIRGAAELKVKESDRLTATVRLLAAFGAKAEATDDGLVIEGGSDFTPATKVASGGDHRIAMSAAIAACFARGESVIDDVGCVETSYPGFHEDLMRVTEKA